MPKVYYDNGYYDGELKENSQTREGFGTYYWKNGDKYVGDYKNNLRSGYGTYYWKDGTKYVGLWENDLKHGLGTHSFTDGSKYRGEWYNDNKDGKGTYYYANGDKYVGEWKNDKKNGQGTYYYFDGSKYIGDWKDNERTGYGKYIYFKNTYDEGEYLANKRHGKVKTFTLNKLLNEGEYKNDQKDGEFIEYYFDNTKQECVYSKNVCNGPFTRYYNDGSITKGNYLNGKIDGIRTVYDYFNGEIIQEEWQNGTFVKQISVKPLKTDFDKDNFKTVNYTDGSKYVGELLNGKRHGRGTLYFANHTEDTPNYYSGFFIKNKYNGKGKLVETYSIGSKTTYVYNGDFKHGFKHGYGTKEYGDSTHFATGYFKLDEISGVCALKNFVPNIEFIIGKMKYGEPTGIVNFSYTNGEYYTGKCKGFEKHGKGHLTYQNGDRVIGKFKNNLLEGKATYICNDTIFKCVYKKGVQISKTKI
ncbi:MAG: hypothetical protein IKV38_03045 [Clostridia bacterium]|nr:hypothetical protein [Clostridia bacterium]